MAKFGGDVLESFLLPVYLFLFGKKVQKISVKSLKWWQRLRGSDLIHLVDGYGQLSDAERAHQQGVFSGLTACLKAGLELPSAGVHHQQSHIGLDRNPERNITHVRNVCWIRLWPVGPFTCQIKQSTN